MNLFHLLKILIKDTALIFSMIKKFDYVMVNIMTKKVTKEKVNR